MKFKISQEVFRLFPDLRLGVIIATGIDNSGTNTEILNMLRKTEAEVRESMALDRLAENPLISNWRKAYKLLKVKDGRPSHEAIARRVLKGNEIPHITNLVDLYNYLSLKYMTPYGGEDLENISGNITLRLATGSEDFMQLGTREITHPNADEVIYADGEKVLCRKFNWRESELTKLTEITNTAFFVTETLPPFPEDTLERSLNEFAENLKEHFHAEVKAHKLDVDHPELEW